jgi:hypothetical protein
LYHLTENGLAAEWEDVLLTPEQLTQRLEGREPILFAGTLGAHRETVLEALGDRAREAGRGATPSARTVARLGAPLLAAGGEPVHRLAPRYVRPSAAEARRVAVAGGEGAS